MNDTSIFTLNGLLDNGTGRFPYYPDRIMHVWTFCINLRAFFFLLLRLVCILSALWVIYSFGVHFSSLSRSLQSLYNLVWLTQARDDWTDSSLRSPFLLRTLRGTDARQIWWIPVLIVVSRSDAIHHYQWVLFVWSLPCSALLLLFKTAETTQEKYSSIRLTRAALHHVLERPALE